MVIAVNIIINIIRRFIGYDEGRFSGFNDENELVFPQRSIVGFQFVNKGLILHPFRLLLSMISFDQNGNITPYTRIQLQLVEINEHFVKSFSKSAARPILYAHFLRYVNDLNQLLTQPSLRWLGGSFISNKLEPSDVDCVNLIVFNERLEHNIDLLMPYLLIGGSLDTYHVDGHLIAVYPATDERYEAITVPSMTYWQNFLMKDRQNNPRGIIELINN